MKRLFFALWPDPQTRTKIEILNQTISIPGIKKVSAHNLHITLLFLGNTDAATEMRLRQLASTIGTQSFVVQFTQLDFWRKPKILCLTAPGYDTQLTLLVDSLTAIAKQCAMQTEDRTYQPHITLARKAHSLINVDVCPIEWQADSFCLLESLSTTSGVRYQVVQRWELEKIKG